MVDHSSVHASHGSAPASLPFRSERMTFQTKKSTPAIWMSTPIRTTDSEFPATVGLVGVDPTRHAKQAGDVHGAEGQVEAEEEQPELPLAQVSDSMRPVTFGNQ